MNPGGAIVACGEGKRSFLPATVLRQIVPEPLVSPVSGAGIGMALVGGRVFAVLELGQSTGTLLICEIAGKELAFSGLRVERVGFFSSLDGGVSVDGTRVAELELTRLRDSAWSGARP